MLVRYRGGEGMLAWAFHRISGVAQVQKIRPFYDPPAIDIKTGNHTPGQHEENTPRDRGIQELPL